MRLIGSLIDLFFLAVLALIVSPSEAFVKGSTVTRSRPLNTQLHAADKKKVDTLRKPEFIAQVAEKMDTTKAGAEAAVSAVLETITDVSDPCIESNHKALWNLSISISYPQNVVDGKKVSLPGFGTFQLKARAARKGRNPQTGEAIDIAASNSPGFSAAKAFKTKANE